MIKSYSAGRGIGALLASTIALGGCATLPTNGPTAHQIEKGARQSTSPLQFSIVDIDSPLVEQLRAQDVELASQAPTLAQLARDSSADTVGPGDVLAINIFEVGVALFSGTQSRAVGDSFDPSAHGQLFPDVVVAKDGTIDLPYAGRLPVAGLDIAGIERAIDRALAKESQKPQAVVTIKINVTNTVYVSGEVRKPGRFELTLNREHILDAIAESGGSTNSAEDTLVRFSRDGRVVEERLGFIRAGTPDDLVLAPGDRVELIKRPRTYTVFGATAKAAQVPFETGAVSLAEAIARSGGPNDAAADAAAIYLFRYDGVPDAQTAGLPKIYHINMLRPESYFLAQRVNMRDKDVIYIANAASNQPSKLVAIINQLFSPFVAIRAVTN